MKFKNVTVNQTPVRIKPFTLAVIEGRTRRHHNDQHENIAGTTAVGLTQIFLTSLPDLIK